MGWPLTSILTVSSLIVRAYLLCRRRRRRGRRRAFDDRAALVLDHVLELVLVVLQEALHRPCRGIAERADRVPLDPIRHIEQQPQVLASALPRDDSAEHAVEPARALAARRALAAGLGIIEARQALQ